MFFAGYSQWQIVAAEVTRRTAVRYQEIRLVTSAATTSPELHVACSFRFRRRGELDDLSHASEPPVGASLARAAATGAGFREAEFELSIVHCFHFWGEF